MTLPTSRARLAGWQLASITLAVVGAAAWGTALELKITAPGFPLDDSWIHLQFARNVAGGHGFSFNPGVPSSGSTAPLWTLLLAIPLWTGLAPVVAGKLLGVALVAVTALAAAALTARLALSAWCGMLAGLAVATSPRVVWAALSGMEVPLYMALTTTALLLYVRASELPAARPGWALCAGLAGWARPETLVAGGVLAIAWTLDGARDATGRRVRGWWRPLVVLLGVTAGFLAFNLWVGGRPLPNTFYAKHYGMGTAASLAEGRIGDAALDAVRYPVNVTGELVWWLGSHGGLLFGAALPGVLSLLGTRGGGQKRPGLAVLGALVATPLAKGLIAPQPILLVHDGRYVLHLLVLGLVVCAAGVAALVTLTGARRTLAALALASLVQIGGATYSMMSTYAAEVKNINDLQVRTGLWLAAHTAADARVATNDIGAIAFFSRRFILDTEGLVTPDAIWDKRMWRIDRFLTRSQPDVVVIFPEWYPYLAQRGGFLREVYRISARKVIAGGEALVIYRTPWTRPGRFAY